MFFKGCSVSIWVLATGYKPVFLFIWRITAMNFLEAAIVNRGEVLPGGILKVGSFLNNQIDISLLSQMGKEFYDHFSNCGVNKILTIEASGIGIACITAQFFNCNVVFAKKSATKNLSGDMLVSKAFSFTHKNENTIIVPKEYIKEDDNILIIDDFLAHGEATKALIDIVNQGGAKVAGIGICIEKGFQGGGDELRKEGYNLYSLAVIDEMNEDGIKFRK